MRSTWVECSCVQFLSKPQRVAPIPRSHIPRTSSKTPRCRHGWRRAPFLCEFCLAKLAHSIFARTQKYCANPLNQVMMQVLRPCIARTYLCGAPGWNVLATSSCPNPNVQLQFPETASREPVPKLSRCRHGRRRAPVSLLVLLCKTSVSDFGTEAKITNQSLKSGQNIWTIQWRHL